MPRAFDPHEPELMDRPQPVSAELETDLLNLASLNRWFGSHRLVRGFLARWFSGTRTLRVLDLATGAGDLPRVITAWSRRRGIAVKIDAVDANESTLAIARTHSRDFPEITFLPDNALTFAPAATYDLVHCSLALHHFSAADATRLLRHARTLSHRCTLIADLERSPATLLGIRALTTLFYRAPMTRADALTSAHRAFSHDEFRALAQAAGWTDFHHTRHLFCRQALSLDEQTPAAIPLPQALPCPT